MRTGPHHGGITASAARISSRWSPSKRTGPHHGGITAVWYHTMKRAGLRIVTHVLAAQLKGELGEQGVRQLVDGGIAELFPEAGAAALVSAQADALLANLDGVEAFPVLPLSAAGTAQGLFERPDHEVPAPEPVTFDLQALLSEGCDPERPTMAPVHPLVPDLMSGTFADHSRDPCNLQRAQDLAEVLFGSQVRRCRTVYGIGLHS